MGLRQDKAELLRQDKAELESKINYLLNKFQCEHEVEILGVRQIPVTAALDTLFKRYAIREVAIRIDLENNSSVITNLR